MGRRVDEDGASGFVPGRGRPWGRVARVQLAGKVKSSERSNFEGERLLGAANGDEPREEITGSKSNPVKEKSALRVARKVVFITDKVWKRHRERKLRPTCGRDTWGTQIHLPALRLCHPPLAPSSPGPSTGTGYCDGRPFVKVEQGLLGRHARQIAVYSQTQARRISR